MPAYSPSQPMPRAIQILNGELLEDILATVQSETRREKYRNEAEAKFPGTAGLGLIAYINGEMIETNKPVRFASGDTFVMGAGTFLIEFEYAA